MANEYYGETEITPQELDEYLKRASKVNPKILSVVLLGAFCVIGWFVVPLFLETYGNATTTMSDTKNSIQDSTSDPRWKFMSVVNWKSYAYVLNAYSKVFFISFIVIAFLVLRLIYRFILKPMGKAVFDRASTKLNTNTEANVGTIIYNVDRYGLEYDIQTTRERNRHKLYWRNLTDAEYAPDTIRLFKGKKLAAFVLMRAFHGREREVGQFIESAMNKVKAKRV